MLARSGGVFLYAYHFCRVLAAGVFADTGELPPGAQFYPAYLARLRDQVGAELYETVYLKTLLLLAAAQQPVTVAQLEAWGVPGARLPAALLELRDLLSVTRCSPPWVPAPRSCSRCCNKPAASRSEQIESLPRAAGGRESFSVHDATIGMVDSTRRSNFFVNGVICQHVLEQGFSRRCGHFRDENPGHSASSGNACSFWRTRLSSSLIFRTPTLLRFNLSVYRPRTGPASRAGGGD